MLFGLDRPTRNSLTATMDRLQQAFEPRADGNAAQAFISYLCAGDPDFETSRGALRILAEEGAAVLEIGVPFSDPLADGKTNQLAAERALASGMRAEDVFRLVRTLRNDGVEQPIVFYTYYNLIFSRGVEAYVRDARAAGVDALLVLDLPPEEGGAFFEICHREGVRTVMIVAPTTPPDRIPIITAVTTGFIYYVSREGVTGERSEAATGIDAAVAAIRAHTSLPVVVGFGISTREQVEATWAAADGAVVGSALVNALAASVQDGDADLDGFRQRVRDLMGVHPG